VGNVFSFGIVFATLRRRLLTARYDPVRVVVGKIEGRHAGLWRVKVALSW